MTKLEVRCSCDCGPGCVSNGVEFTAIVVLYLGSDEEDQNKYKEALKTLGPFARSFQAFADGDEIVDVASSIEEIVKIQKKIRQLEELKVEVKKLVGNLKDVAGYSEESELFLGEDIFDPELFDE